MGYISEVAVAIKSDVYDSFYSSLNDQARELVDCSKIHKNEDGVLIHWDYIKWYYESVDYFMNSLRMIDSEDWYLIEVGEDVDHNTQLGGWHDNPFDLWIQRTIHITH